MHYNTQFPPASASMLPTCGPSASKPAGLFFKIRQALTRPKSHLSQRDVHLLMLVEACRGLSAGDKMAALLSEVQVSPDVDPSLAMYYGEKLNAHAWELQRGGL